MLLLTADFFQNQSFKKNSFKNVIRVSNSLDPDQGLIYCRSKNVCKSYQQSNLVGKELNGILKLQIQKQLQDTECYTEESLHDKYLSINQGCI